MNRKKVFLTVGGSDPCGGAGIQADIRTAERLGLYPCSVITAVTAQNSAGFYDAWTIPPSHIKDQLKAVLSDFYPDAVKIGMISSPDAVEIIADLLEEAGARNIVVDPIVSPTLKSVSNTLNEKIELMKALASRLFPIAAVVTPNIPEATSFREITGLPMESLCSAFLIKGGHTDGDDIVDELYYHDSGNNSWSAPSTAFPTLNFNHSALFNHDNILPSPDERDYGLVVKKFFHKRMETSNTHGTGCILSSALACFLANGKDLDQAAGEAVKFTFQALQKSMKYKLSKGNYGPSLI